MASVADTGPARERAAVLCLRGGLLAVSSLTGHLPVGFAFQDHPDAAADQFLGLAILALSLLQFAPHALPRPLIWFGALTGAYLIVSDPIQLAISHSPAGATGPISVVLSLVWVLAVTVVMLVKPVRNTTPQQAAATEASLAS